MAKKIINISEIKKHYQKTFVNKTVILLNELEEKGVKTNDLIEMKKEGFSYSVIGTILKDAGVKSNVSEYILRNIISPKNRKKAA